MSNTEKVLNYIKQHGSITVRQAAVELEINSPTKTISNIRKLGFPRIETWKENQKTGKRYKVYSLIREVSN